MKATYHEAGATHTEVQPCAFIDDGVFVTKSGATGIALRLTGPDPECMDAIDLNSITQRFDGAMRLFGPDFRVYQYLLKRRITDIPHQCGGNVTCDRALYLEAKGLFAFDHYIVILNNGDRPGALLDWLPGRNISVRIGQAIRDAAARLRHQAEAFALQLRDVLNIRLADKREAYQLLRRLLNYDPAVAEGTRLKYDGYIDYFAADSAIEGHRGFLRVGDHFVRVLTLKDLPASTRPDMLQALRELPAEAIIATEWQAVDSFDARQLITRKISHFHRSKYVVNILATVFSAFSSNPQQERPEDMQKDESATAMESQLGELLTGIEREGTQLGQFALTVVLHDTNQRQLERATAEARKALAGLDATLYEERQNVLSAWLAVLPGGNRNQFRSQYLSNRNYADMSLLFSTAHGQPWNEHLSAEYLAALETRQRTPYYQNLHYQDVGHTLISGVTGSGKSFTCSFLLEHAQKYGPQTVIFDLGGSYRELTRRLCGSYMSIGIERNEFTINPFHLAPTPENLHFLFSFVKVLIEAGEYRMTDRDDKELHSTIVNIYQLDQDVRLLGTVAACLPLSMRPHLARWVDGGQYAALFDNAEDTLTCSRFHTFDFEGMQKYPQILEPLLFYILHRANAHIYGSAAAHTLKLFLLDEAWLFFRNPTVKAYIVEGLKTWRKRNAAMILATQSSADLIQSDMLQTVAESCGSLIFLANPRMDREHYKRVFRLNDTEAELIANLQPKRELLIKRPGLAKVVRLEVPTADAACAAEKPNNPSGAICFNESRSSSFPSSPVVP
jgi:type IV secretion/conjugal transfer VirB4 family ATPase